MLTRGTQTQIRLNRPRVTHGRRHIVGAKLRVDISPGVRADGGRVMADNVVILPKVRIDEVAPGVRMHVVRVPLTGRALGRLRKRAEEWGISIEEAASGVLDQALAPPARRRK